MVYKDSGPQLYLTLVQDVEHEAYVLLLAERGGAYRFPTSSSPEPPARGLR